MLFIAFTIAMIKEIVKLAQKGLLRFSGSSEEPGRTAKTFPGRWVIQGKASGTHSRVGNRYPALNITDSGPSAN